MSKEYYTLRLSKEDIEKIMWALDKVNAFFGLKMKIQAKIDEWRERGRW